MKTGLYRKLVKEGLLIPHEESTVTPPDKGTCYKILRPEPVAFISYTYEWSFSQLSDAALATLKIQQICLEYGMSLKDSTAYNIQFRDARPVLIDTTSFKKYRNRTLWPAYRQFCQHFLAPLALMSRVDVRLNQLMRVYIDGIPLDLASSLLPCSSYASFGLLSHIHLHSKAQRKYASTAAPLPRYGVGRLGLLALVDSLRSCVKSLKWKPNDSEWLKYNDECSYSIQGQHHKKETVDKMLRSIQPHPKMLWDLGANLGRYSRLASALGCSVLAFDSDPACVQVNYLETQRKGELQVLPLLMDLTNPSTGIGWAGRERQSLVERGPADAVLALAIVHHLAISNNLPLPSIADFMQSIGKALIIEFVPKSDVQVRNLLANRNDIYPEYTKSGFEVAFGKYFTICEAVDIADTDRTIYLMQK